MKVNLWEKNVLKMFLYCLVHKYGSCLTEESWDGLCFPCENSPEFCQFITPRSSKKCIHTLPLAGFARAKDL